MVAAVIVTAVVVAVGWHVIGAFSEPPHQSIVGTVTGPCDVAPSYDVVVYGDNDEPVGSGAVGASSWTGVGTCAATISVNDVEPAERYTVDAGPLSAEVSESRVGGSPTIVLTRKIG